MHRLRKHRYEESQHSRQLVEKRLGTDRQKIWNVDCSQITSASSENVELFEGVGHPNKREISDEVREEDRKNWLKDQKAKFEREVEPAELEKDKVCKSEVKDKIQMIESLYSSMKP